MSVVRLAALSMTQTLSCVQSNMRQTTTASCCAGPTVADSQIAPHLTKQLSYVTLLHFTNIITFYIYTNTILRNTNVEQICKLKYVCRIWPIA